MDGSARATATVGLVATAEQVAQLADLLADLVQWTNGLYRQPGVRDALLAGGMDPESLEANALLLFAIYAGAQSLSEELRP